MNFSELPEITGGKIIGFHTDKPVTHLLSDSRKPILHEGAVFFSFKGKRNDGHNYIQALYEVGIRQFIVENEYPFDGKPDVNVLLVNSSLAAIQKLAAYHRKLFSIPVIGITGSNGKTIIKEWLYQLLSHDYNAIKNPGSYNSQLGVPLSVWGIQPHHQLGIFEAGISRPGEMINLQQIIQPAWGLFTNIGTAHDENFSSLEQKIEEKLILFKAVNRLVYCTDHTKVNKAVKASGLPSLSWGQKSADVIVTKSEGLYRFKWNEHDFSIRFIFADEASVENAIHCIVLMLGLGYSPQLISQRIQKLQSVPMRLELKEGINHCQLIDDTYNNDLGGLRISLDLLAQQHQHETKSLILSDILQSGLPESKITNEIAQLVNQSGVSKFIGIGPMLFNNQTLFTVPSTFYQSVEDFINSTKSENFINETVLIKGARTFRFERIVKQLEKKVHGTVMEIDLNILTQNLNYFKSKLAPRTKIMVMVKALAYGSGSIQIANILQYHQVNYLGVAYADEGIELRQNNITTPIMVMNPSPESFESIYHHNLEPEIYSFKILDELVSFLDGRRMSIHIKLDTGMHRLGFEIEQVDKLIDILSDHPNLTIASIFSHLAGSDEAQHDEFSREQSKRFAKAATQIKRKLGVNPLLHILNTSGIIRFPDLQLDMVRLGIGLYGVDPTNSDKLVKSVVTMKTVISQIKEIKKGQSIGYSRKGVALNDLKIATIAIGYADGFSRAFSGGVGTVLVGGKRSAVIGNVCMDMTMIDITGIEANEGDEVIIFGDGLPIQEVASKIKTIPYEILTNTSDRVRRIFVAEGI